VTIDTSEVGSPGWWLKRLMERLGNDQRRLTLLNDYYRGEPPLPWGPENCRETFRRMQRKARANFAQLIADAPVERMQPVGFRTGAAGDLNGDDQAWRMWQANNLDAEAPLLFSAKSSMSRAYTIVGGPDPSTGFPLITCEDPRQVITEQHPANRRRTIAALKVWADDVAQADRAKLFLPGIVFTARRTRSDITGSPVSFDASGWEWENDGERLPAFAADIVPVTLFPNRPDLSGATLGEFEDVIDSLDRINLMLLQRLTVGIMQAFRQRAVKGNLPERDAEGNEIDYGEVFVADPGAIWELPADVDIWESAGVDLTPLLESVKADVRDVAGITRTPMFYLFPDAANGSAEGASLHREGLIFKTSAHIVQASDPLEQTMALGFLFMGDTERAKRPDMEVLWQAPERVSMAERYDAASKAQASEVPWETRMRDVLGFTPQQIKQMQAERIGEQFLARTQQNQETAGVSAGG